MAKKKQTPKPVENKQEAKVPDYLIHLNLTVNDLLSLTSGDSKYGDYNAEDGKWIRFSLNPVDGGIPVDVKLIEMFADRYEKLAEAMMKSVKRLKEKK